MIVADEVMMVDEVIFADKVMFDYGVTMAD